jgi:hypothetical protein
MAQKRGNYKASTPASKKGGSKRKNKQPTQKPAMQRVAVMGPTGKVRFEWRPW